MACVKHVLIMFGLRWNSIELKVKIITGSIKEMTCPNKLTPIFVYGTLIPIAKDISCGMEPIEDEIENVDMYNLGRFPGIIKGTGSAKGLIICVDNDILRRLDEYEGEGYLYSRVNYITKGGRPVNVYFFKQNLPPTAKKIESGDWMNQCG